MLENRNVQANEPLVQVVNWLIGNVDVLCRVSHRLWNLAGLKPENLGKRSDGTTWSVAARLLSRECLTREAPTPKTIGNRCGIGRRGRLGKNSASNDQFD